MITIIAARSRNGVIGNRGKIPWHLPADLKRFKDITAGHSIIMGRKTYESLPRKPLTDRENIVVTKQRGYEASGCIVVHSLVHAIAVAIKEHIFIIGGESLYRDALDEISEQIFLTEVHIECEGDAFFPEFDQEIWEEDFRISDLPAPNQPPSEFVIYKRRKQKPPTP